MDADEFPCDADKGVWAAGNRRTNFVHYYASKKDYENRVCLCGRIVEPHIPFTKWDTDNPEVRKVTCPDCLRRMWWLKFR